MDDWYRLLQAGVDGDKEKCKEYSLKLRYLTGEESQVCIANGVSYFIHLLVT
jgi:aarF domain-containing kinase